MKTRTETAGGDSGSNNRKVGSRQVRIRIILLLTVIIPLGLLSKIYAGPGSTWCNDYAGGILYEIFWCLTFFFLFPRKNTVIPISVGVFAGTALLEILQLVDHPVLEAIRSRFLGRTLIGSTFSLLDFPHYFLGCVIGALLMKRLLRDGKPFRRGNTPLGESRGR